jgi:uncharacterized pyridoxal phosphate-containing UPF0001 family protein
MALTGLMAIPFFTEPQRRQQKALTATSTSAQRQTTFTDQRRLAHGRVGLLSLALLAPMGPMALTGLMAIPFFTAPQRRQQKALMATSTSEQPQTTFTARRHLELGQQVHQ